MSGVALERPSEGLFSFVGGLKGKFWAHIERPDAYIRALRVATPLASQEWFWNDRRLLHRLDSLERFALWKGEEWRADKDVEETRRAFLKGLRETVGPRLKEMPDDGERRRVNQWLARLEARLGVVDPYCRPSRARLELTDACNLRCRMCPQSFWEWDRNYAEEWILERARSLYPWLLQLDYTSFGETLLAPLFKQALLEAPTHAHTVLISNGLLINDDWAQFLVENHLSELHVSIDAASRGAYQAMRGVDAFERVVENAKRLVGVKKRLGKSSPTLVFNFTLTRKNIDDLVPLIRLAAEIGFQRVHMNYLMVWIAENSEDSVFWIRDRACEAVDEADRVARELGVEYFHPPKLLREHEGVERFETFCPEAWEIIYLRSMGKVSVCCMSADEFVPPPEMSWEEVWDSPAYQAFRRRVNLPGDQAPPLCRNCFYGRDVQPGDPRFHFFSEALVEHLKDTPKHPYLTEPREAFSPAGL
ncbi:MAG: hypothetical protein GHCLOJNM_03604 [bacterium]|nr:hypothetical protein [bacterium]